MVVSAAFLATAFSFGLLLWHGDAAPALAEGDSIGSSGMSAGKRKESAPDDGKLYFMAGGARPNIAFPMPPPFSPRGQEGDGELIPLDPESVAPADVDFSRVSPPPQNAPVQQEPTKVNLPPSEAVVPKLTGHIKKSGDDESDEEKWSLPAGQASPPTAAGAIAHPALYFMEGADLEKISPPKCQLTGCSGPVPNDHDFMLTLEASAKASAGAGSTCHQTFVPLNSCFEGGKGYPVGMICTICCECSTELEAEMRKSRGYRAGLKANVGGES